MALRPLPKTAFLLPKKLKWKINLKVGDKVLYKKWGGEEIKIGAGKDEETYKILYVGAGDDKSDIIATL